ncbi:phosphoribosylglycinamide formyltransferase [Hyphobacterium marinum]|uniref:Phosphoribosylglycinamide formyltransferase n=1 Tax=Hyphobacterium marinum TaxID=3116574 RepID=A0ABU7M081_9PROT|nr:phosphoribosylglycinamide formyltransferase [Hyphobacterium sp. Y6023]MEE2567204.1 phosphoribosylglycinamide formyltransferase [Hyphobacterium sp. Y6023]
MAKTKIAILISGRGSNMQALIDACAAEDYPAEIVLVVSNNPGAKGLERAALADIPTAVVDHRGYDSREAFEETVHNLVKASGAQYVFLAGFMRILTPWFVGQWRDRLVNIHPSLLPCFTGVHTHERAIEAGVKLHGCTVHYVRPEMDDGPIIGQAAVPVLPGDTPDTLAERVLAAEHRLYPACVKLVCEGKARVVGEVVRLSSTTSGMLLNPGA